MKPLKSRPVKESVIVDRVRSILRSQGYGVVEKTHGNRYMKGWPDLYAYSKVRENHRWIEVKRPNGKLTPAQASRFRSWEAEGLDVQVATLVPETDLIVYSSWRAWI